MNLRVCFKTYLLIRCLHVKHALFLGRVCCCCLFFFFLLEILIWKQTQPRFMNCVVKTTDIFCLWPTNGRYIFYWTGLIVAFRCQLSIMQCKAFSMANCNWVAINKNIKAYRIQRRKSLSFLTWHMLKGSCGSHSGLRIHACMLSPGSTTSSHFHLPHCWGCLLCLCSSTAVHNPHMLCSVPPGCSLSCFALTWLTQQPSWHSSQTLSLTNLKRLIFSLFTAHCCRL